MTEAREAATDLVGLFAIRKNLAQHSRGIDRSDPGLLAEIYHQGAKVDYGFFNGDAPDFIPLVTATELNSLPTLHRTSNIWIKLAGKSAISESYVIAYTTDQHAQSFIGGRYLDTHSIQDGRWRLDHRLYVLDWNMNWPVTGSAASGFLRPLNFGNQRELDPTFGPLTEWNKQKGTTTMHDEEHLADVIEEILVKQEIHDLIMAQARATDRSDLDGLMSSWHPGALVDTGSFVGSVEEYGKMLLEAEARCQKVSHHIANEWVEVSGNRAISESYVMAFKTVADADDTRWDELNGGRYLDQFKKIDGAWKFTNRVYIGDWQIRHPCTDQSDQGIYEALSTRGDKFPNDPVYRHWHIDPVDCE